MIILGLFRASVTIVTSVTNLPGSFCNIPAEKRSVL